MPKVVRLWPGLPQLWMRGGGAGLALAMAFTVLLNVMLIASLVWTQWLRFDLLVAGWSAVVLLWGASFSIGGVAPATTVATEEVDEFPQAQLQYLQGNWFEAERLLNRCLTRNVKDVESRLLLATLWRHLGRLEEAEQQLVQMERFDNAVRWRQEIERERQLLARCYQKLVEEEESVEEAADGPEPENLSEGLVSSEAHP